MINLVPMENEFLNSLYNEEQVIYNKIIANPLYEELLEIQKFIIRRGGTPNYKVGVKHQEQVITLASSINETKQSGIVAKLKEEIAKINHSILFGDTYNYNKGWTWDLKGEYAFEKLGKCTPKDMIDFICIQEGIGESNKDSRSRVSANLYNVVSKFYKAGKVTKDETDKTKGVQYELKQKTSHLSEVS